MDMKRFHIPNMILIGATARNSGKTTLALSIIKKFKSRVPVFGLKVTTIAKRNGGCIHGGEGCGACSSLKDANFEIAEEKNDSGNKDTSMLLAAGAQRVFWLKVLFSHLDEGIEAVLKMIPEGSLIICESNSLRKIVEPGVFVMVKNSEDSFVKKSAEEVIGQADIIFENQFTDDFQDVLKEIELKLKI